MRKAIVMGMACAALLWISTAQAATGEGKCLAGRAVAAAKYDGCVQKWLAKLYGGLTFDTAAEETMASCRIKYVRAWTKLQQLTGSTTCSGQPRYVDNGNGTITDNLTGLVWEKKSKNGDVHDRDAAWTWSTGAPYNGDGTAFTTFLRDGLNAAAGFAGANDWRVPTFAELQTIVLPEPYPCSTHPCVDPVFNTGCAAACTVLTCSCTSGYYWSATTGAFGPGDAWIVNFSAGHVTLDGKSIPLVTRAVRGGL